LFRSRVRAAEAPLGERGPHLAPRLEDAATSDEMAVRVHDDRGLAALREGDLEGVERAAREVHVEAGEVRRDQRAVLGIEDGRRLVGRGERAAEAGDDGSVEPLVEEDEMAEPSVAPCVA